MRWINKRDKQNRKRGHAIVKKFLNRGWDNTLGRYVNCSYSDILGEGSITHLLLREQGYVCCYCMRAIAYKKHTTLEHVLPRKTKQEDSNTITYYLNSARYMKRYVKWTKEPPQYRVKVPPFPHYCAYENLVASCDGSVYDINNPDYQYPSKLHNCCNNIRGQKEIIPMFFLENIDHILIYESDGELTYDDMYESTINAINLQYPTLKLMRRAWAKISKLYTVEDVENAVVNKDLRDVIIDDSLLSSVDGNLLKKDNFWNLLLEYRWFYTYFKQKRYKRKG